MRKMYANLEVISQRTFISNARLSKRILLLFFITKMRVNLLNFIVVIKIFHSGFQLTTFHTYMMLSLTTISNVGS
jgi:hypothetical protein